MAASSRQVIVKVELVVVVGVVLFLLTFVTLFFFYLRRKRYWGAYPAAVVLPLHHQQQDGDHQRDCGDRLVGIDQSSLEALLPSTKIVSRNSGRDRNVSSPAEEEGRPAREECAVCLGELREGDSVRVLPRCGHAFHVSCIDKWLLSASACGCCCPLCRTPILQMIVLRHRPASFQGADTGDMDEAPAIDNNNAVMINITGPPQPADVSR